MCRICADGKRPCTDGLDLGRALLLCAGLVLFAVGVWLSW